MYTAKESSSETPFNTPIGESSSLDEILFTKRRCARCVLNKIMSTRGCRHAKEVKRPVERRSCINQTDPCLNGAKSVKPISLCERRAPPPPVNKDCVSTCPPKIPDLPEDSISSSAGSMSDLFSINDCQGVHQNIISMESSHVALLTKERVQVKKTTNENMKITFNDDSECICIHVPKYPDENQSASSECARCCSAENLCEFKTEASRRIKEKPCKNENKSVRGRIENFENNMAESCNVRNDTCAKCLTGCEEEKEKCPPANVYHGKSFVDCEENEKCYDYPERNRKYEVMDKQCRDFNENIHYRIQRAINPDTNVVIDGNEFPCHLLALQVYSKKLDDEIRPTLFRLELPSSKVSAKIFRYLMDWILATEENKNFVICSENVVGLYCASKFLQMSELNLQCSDYIQKKVSEEDPKMIAMWEETRGRCDCEEVQILFSSKLSRMFMKLYKSGQFLHFKVDEMIMVLGNDSLCITSEMDVYDAVVRWLLYDWDERKGETDKIMHVVRFGLISAVDLMKLKHCMKDPNYSHIFTCAVEKMIQNGVQYSVLSENYNRRPGELKKWIQLTKVSEPKPRLCLLDYYVHSEDVRISKTEIVECHRENSKETEQHIYENITEDRQEQIKILLEEDTLAERRDSAARIIQRKVRKYLKKKIVILGGCDPMTDYESRKESCYKIYAYENKNWEGIQRMPEPRTHFSAIPLEGLVYIIGGCDPRFENHEGRSVATKSVWSWNVKNEEWTQLASMHSARSHFGCVAFNGLIYAFGGQDEKARALSKCEMYNPERNKWTEISPMQHPTFSMAIVKHNDFIWLIGGVTKMRQLPLLDSVSMYKPEDNEWIHSDIPFPFPIGFSSALVFKGEIYLFGGVNNLKASLNSVFRFDFELLAWVDVGELQLARHAHSLVLFGSSAVLIGGVNTEKQDVVASVECFDLKSLRTEFLSRLPCKMTGVAGICLQ